MKTCLHCKLRFKPKRKEQVYCSMSCASVKKGRMRKGQKTGPQKNRVYKKQTDKDGYVRMIASAHPYRGGRLMILEHVMVMELRIKRRIRPEECVHHKDGDRKNNKIENLELQTRSEHSKLHGPKTAKKRKRDWRGRFA